MYVVILNFNSKSMLVVGVVDVVGNINIGILAQQCVQPLVGIQYVLMNVSILANETWKIH